MPTVDHVARHVRFRDFVKIQSIGIPRSDFWENISPNFEGRLSASGYENHGSANYFPIMSGRPIAEQFPSAPHVDDPALDELYMRCFGDATAQWNPELRNIRVHDNQISIGAASFEYDSHFWRALHTLYAVNHFAGRYLDAGDRILEIGAGSGLVTAAFVAEYDVKSMIIDLPEMLTVSSALLMTMFPGKKFCLPNEVGDADDLEEYDIVFLFPNQLGHCKNFDYSLAMNISSFMEMDLYEVRRYFQLISRRLKDGAIFFSSNRDKITRLDDYPWNEFGNFETVYRAPNGVLANIPPWSNNASMVPTDDIRKFKKSWND